MEHEDWNLIGCAYDLESIINDGVTAGVEIYRSILIQELKYLAHTPSFPITEDSP